MCPRGLTQAKQLSDVVQQCEMAIDLAGKDLNKVDLGDTQIPFFKLNTYRLIEVKPEHPETITAGASEVKMRKIERRFLVQGSTSPCSVIGGNATFS